MLKLSDLAQQADFRLGPLSVSPSRRRVEGPAGQAHVEPLVMQAFLLLVGARGKVVTRQELFDQLWGGAMVGDDSLNRAIAGVRRIAAETAPDLFEIGTVPRTGYRLVGDILNFQQEVEPVGITQPSDGNAFSRRLMIGAGLGAVVAVGGTGLWLAGRDRADPRFEALMARGDELLRNGDYQDPKAASLYEQAVRLDPLSAKAWGLLAFFKSEGLEDAPPEKSRSLIEQAEEAARRAREIDPSEPNALTAMLKLQGATLEWANQDQRLRKVLAIDGDNIPALRELMVLTQAAGLTRESWGYNEQILKLAPLSRPHLVNRAQKLWLAGNIARADKVIDHVRGLWPDYSFGFAVRLTIFALTDRPRAARALLDSNPEMVSPFSATLWRAALQALDSRTTGDIEAAQAGIVGLAKERPQAAHIAVMILGALGLKDDAFEVAEGFLLGRGNLVGAIHTNSTVTNFNRRNTPWLFSPPLAEMRADPRFLRLCEEFGLTAYWRARGVKPDYMRA